MYIRKKILPSSLISLLIVSLVSASIVRASTVGAQQSPLTWSIQDEGIDTNSNGLFDFLGLTVTVQVTEPGYYSASASGLRNSTSWNSTSVEVSDYDGAYFEVGTRMLNLSFYGPVVAASNVVNASLIQSFSISYPSGGEMRSDLNLSKSYSYFEFDSSAWLTGQVQDIGVDTDLDGKFNYLEVSVEVNVANPRDYDVYGYGLGSDTPVWFWIDVSGYGSAHLEAGLQAIAISFSGAKIYASGGNFGKVQFISLSETFVDLDGEKRRATLDRKSTVPLSRTYSYDEFDALARLTGKITDRGVDTDGDLRFNYLEVGTEVEVFEPGSYQLSVGPLANSTVGFNASGGIINVWNYSYVWLDPGLRLVNVSLYGPAIFASGINPSVVVDIYLYMQYPEYMQLGNLHNAELSHAYLHTAFDAHAYLTGKLHDKGVDVDGSGKYDRLDVGVEVEVEDAGTYFISIEALADEVKNTYYEYYYPTYRSVYLDPGTKVVNFSFYGPKMYQYRFNPRMATRIGLSERPVYWWWDGWIHQMSNVLLSRQYMYSEFDASFKDMEARFTVYPNRTVVMGGSFNHTHMEYPNTGPSVEQELGISKSGDLTVITTDGKVTLPKTSRYSYWYPYPPYYYYGLAADQWPYNSSVVSAKATYSEGTLNAGVNASVTLPSMTSSQYPFNSSDLNVNLAYSNGILTGDLSASTVLPASGASMFPFNVTDFSLNADYVGGTLKGTITFHILSGFPLGDLTLDFMANRTDVSAAGSVTVIFGTYPYYPKPIEINETFVDNIIANITALQGQGPGSLYNMTSGKVEFLSSSTINKTPLPDDKGATVTFNLLFHGDFVGLVAFLLYGQSYSPQYDALYDLLDSALTSLHKASIQLAYSKNTATATLKITFEDDLELLAKDVITFANRTIPVYPDYWAWYTRVQLYLLNATFNSLDSFSLQLAYSSTTKTFDLKLTIADNLKQLWEDVKEILIETAQPEMKTFYEQLLNVTYCKVKTVEASATYEKGEAMFAATVVVEEDFRKEVNHLKSIYINALVESYKRYPMPIPWQWYYINQTEVDLSNLQLYFKWGETSMYVSFEGAMAAPTFQAVEGNGFRLSTFFNLTNDPYESPRFGERLKVTVLGGANGTHTIIVSRPLTVPMPDWTSDYQTEMVWNNRTISSLRDLMFDVRYHSSVGWNGKTYSVVTQSDGAVSPVTFDQSHKQISLTIDGQTGTSGFANISIPKELLNANYNEWIIMINDNPISYPNYQVRETGTHTFLYFTFTYTSPVNISIVGTTVVPEYQTSLVLPLFMAITLIVIGLGKAKFMVRRRRQS